MANITLPSFYKFDTAQPDSESPFSLYGKPMTNAPNVLKNTETINGNIFNSGSSIYNFQIKLLTEHILPVDPDTTLRDANRSYTLQFACIHKGLRDENSSPKKETLELSLVFLSGNAHIYHINVPIQIAEDSIDENLFLNSWLYENPIKEFPRGFTFNQILNMKSTYGDKTKVATYTTPAIKVKINPTDQDLTTILQSYTFCRFENSIKVNRKALKPWILNMKNITPSVESTLPTSLAEANIKSYRPRDFSQILKILLPNIFTEIPNIRFDTNSANSSIYYFVNLKNILGKLQYSTDPKKLQNVKCYPIDIATQVNDDGSVNLDTTGLRATSVTKESDVGKSKYTGLSAEDSNYYIRIFAIAVIVFLSLLAIIAIVVVFFAGGARKEAMKKAVQQLTTEKASLRAGFPPTQATIT